MPSLALYRRIPWYVRIPAKMVLARIPLPHRVWHRIGLFRHGQMTDVEYAYRVFRLHYDRAGLAASNRSFTMLELGPGDSALSAVFARAHGAERSLLVDAAPCATRDAHVYQRARTLLASEGLETDFLQPTNDFHAILACCGAEYFHKGLRSLETIATDSVDFIWSQAVLEHIQFDEFEKTLYHLRRILRPDGVASHRIDLRDHLGGALNHLRFSRKRWESPLFARSGFYTNRIRFAEMLGLFESAGFAVNVVHVDRWNGLPTRRSALDAEFRSLPSNDLCVRGFDVLLRPDAQSLPRVA